MRSLFLIAGMTFLGLVGYADPTIVAASGAPAVALDARTGPPDPASATTIRVAMDSGNVGGANTERWSAFQFTILQAATINGIEINYYEKLTQLPITYGWKLYSDNGDQPGVEIAGGTGIYAALALASTAKTYPNDFDVERVTTVPIPDQALAPGKFWVTVYGVDGNLPQFVGAPGGSKATHGWRKSTAGSAYAQFETKLFSMPSWGGNIIAGYSALGAGPPYDYSGWHGNEQQGRDLYHIAYSIVNTSGANGSTVTGTLSAAGWATPPMYYFPGDPSSLQAFDVYFMDVASGQVQTICTVNLDATGKFITPKVLNGIYDVAIFPRHWYVGRYTCTSGETDYEQPYVTGFAHPFLPHLRMGVNISGGSVDLGAITLVNGDCDVSSQISVLDLNSILIRFASAVVGSCPPPWDTYVFGVDCDADGAITVLDLNQILVNFTMSGPSRQ